MINRGDVFGALTDDELAALIAAARKVLVDNRFPLPPRLRPLREALAKIEAMTSAATTSPVAPLAGSPAVAT